jgi:hypothetical protein
MSETSAATTPVSRAGRIATEYLRRLERALLHESHARHLRAGEPDPKCPHCLVERPWPPLTSV